MARLWVAILILTPLRFQPVALGGETSQPQLLPISARKSTFRKFVAPPSSDYSPGRIIVKLKPKSKTATQSLEPLSAFTSRPSLLGRMEKFGVYRIEKVFPNDTSPTDPALPDLSRLYVLELPTSWDSRAVAAAFRADPAVEYAEPVYNRRISFDPDDPLYPQQVHLLLVQAAQAWDVTKGDSSVVIAIVDTGVDWTHEDLRDNIWRNPGEIPINGIDDDGNGFVDDVRGWDFADDDNNPKNPNLGVSNHGTWVAGTAAATTNNGVGVAGVGFLCRIMPLKVQSDGSAGTALSGLAIARAIRYAADNGADIINMSFGGSGLSTAEVEAIEYAYGKGVVLVGAAGNEGSRQPSFPAAHPHVLAVAATDNSDRKAGFSNFGVWVDMAAPGTAILTTASTDTVARVQGTSFSTPIVSGIAGLVRSQHPDWSHDEVAQQVRATADDLALADPAFAPLLGKGRADAFAAVTRVTPSIRLVDIEVDDSAGDGDGIVDPGETIRIVGSFHNFLEPAENVTLGLSSSDPNVTITSGNIDVGTITRGETRSNVSNPFVFEVSPEAENGRILEFTIDIRALGYQDRDNFSLIVFPLFGDHDVGNVILTVTAFGALGFNDYAVTDELLGSGFRFPHDNPDRALFHGGFIVAIDSAHVSDVSYGDSFHSRMDFKTIKGRELTFGLTEFSDQDGEAAFSDSVAESPIGINVVQRSYSWATPPNDDFVILDYEVINTGLTELSGVYTAVYLDWDIGNIADNSVEYDEETGVGYMFSPNSMLYGLAAIQPSAASGFRAVRNRFFVWPSSSPPGFTDAEKFELMTEGFVVVRSGVEDDWSVLMTIGPFDLPPAESQRVAYALIGGTNLQDLRANTIAARNVFATVNVNDPQVPPEPPRTFALFQNHPNPFNPSTTIRYQVAEGAANTDVRLTVYNVLGQRVRTLVQRQQAPGRYAVKWDGKDDRGQTVPSGVYLYRFEAGRFVQARKMLLVR